MIRSNSIENNSITNNTQDMYINYILNILHISTKPNKKDRLRESIF